MNVQQNTLKSNPFAAKAPSAAAENAPLAASAEGVLPAKKSKPSKTPPKNRPTCPRDFNNQSPGEEIANAISHGVGAALAIAGTVVLIVCAALYSDAMGVVSSCLYGFSLVFLYLMSTLYHSITNVKAKAFFQVMDHCTIFILILGSYIPVCLSLLGGPLGWTLFGINAFFAVLGIVANAVDVRRWQRFSLVLYLLMGWSIVFCIRPVLALVPPLGFWLLLAGGLCYTIGVIFFALRKPRYMHCIWHLFVLGGSIFHYFFILFFVVIRKGF